MNNAVSILIGLVIFGVVVNSLMTGESNGLTAGFTMSRDITFNNNPVEFCLVFSIGFMFVGGGLKGVYDS